MDIRKIKKLIDLVTGSGIAEIEIHEREEWVRISRHHGPSAPAHTVFHAPEPTAPDTAARASLTAQPEVKAKPEFEGHPVTAPMVGTFYLGPSPTSRPFVEVGQRVKRGDVLCIIEAMKVMNQIEADTDGAITAILVENGQPVEYDQPLFVIKRG
ncbi:MAG: acetyl-CoA carboxylase biotin carboxyl carrier protein [Gammaproteobacteria bacterium]